MHGLQKRIAQVSSDTGMIVPVSAFGFLDLAGSVSKIHIGPRDVRSLSTVVYHRSHSSSLGYNRPHTQIELSRRLTLTQEAHW